MTQAVASQGNTCEAMRGVRTATGVGSDDAHVQPASEWSPDLRQAVQDGIDSGPAIPADLIFAELTARYASHPA